MTNIFKDLWTTNSCKKCDYSTLSSIKMWRHLTKVEKVKPTKKDIKFLIKWSILGRLVMTLLELIFIIVNIVIFVITYPMWKIHDVMFH